MQLDTCKATDNTGWNVNCMWYISDTVLKRDINLFSILQ